MMWTVDSSQGSNPLRGTNAPLTIQVKVTIRPHRGHLTTRTPGSSWWAWCKCKFVRWFSASMLVSQGLSVPKLERVNCDIWKKSNLRLRLGKIVDMENKYGWGMVRVRQHTSAPPSHTPTFHSATWRERKAEHHHIYLQAGTSLILSTLPQAEKSGIFCPNRLKQWNKNFSNC